MNKTYIIAEAGVNHNGKLNRAKQLVDIAFDVGADAVKFQLFKSTELVTSKTKKRCIKETKRMSQLGMLKKLN